MREVVSAHQSNPVPEWVMMGPPDDLGEAWGEGGGVRLCNAPTAACAIALL